MKSLSFIFRLILAGLLVACVTTACQEDELAMLEEEVIKPSIERKAFPKLVMLPKGFQPEGIAVGKGTDFYVGSIISGAIYKGDLKAEEQGAVLVPPQQGKSALGLSFDHRSDLLFVAGGFTGNASVYHTGSGALVESIQFVADPQNTPTMVNDVVVTKKAAYFTDCFRPFVYKVPLGPAGRLPDPITFEAIGLDGFQMTQTGLPQLFNLPLNANGIDATPNGKHLIVVNLTLGLLYRVDAMTGESKLIDLGGESVQFGDGILLDGHTLYVARNFPNMITVIRLSPDLLSGQVTGTITDQELKIPSTLAEFGNAIYAVNARFDVAPPIGPFPDTDFSVVRLVKP